MKLPLRQVVFWLHLSAGIAIGAVVAVMSVTGVLLAFEEQVTTWADGGVPVPTDPAAERLAPSVLLAAAAATVPDAAPTSLRVHAAPDRPAEVRFGRGRTVLVDPWSGRVLGPGAATVREAFSRITAIHRWLGAEGEGRDAGRRVTGAANLAFAVLVASGLYLWVPPLVTRRRLRNVAWFRGGLEGKARDFNWHNVLGVWLAVPLLLIVLSGVVISYPWASGLLYRLVGDEAPERRGRGGEDAEPAPPETWQALDRPWETALAHEPGWVGLAVDVPPAGASEVEVTVTRGGRGRPDLRRNLSLALAGGELLAVENFADQSRGRRARSWLRWIHTGEAGGVVGQALAALASAGATVLVWTGWALAWRRLVRRRRSALGAPSSARTTGLGRGSGADILEELRS